MAPQFPSAVIVALPQVGHPLHEIVNPAEGGPAHMTLAYLGEFEKWTPEEIDQIRTELRDISTDAYQFTDTVASREKLGESQADVLKTDGAGSQKIRDVLTNTEGSASIIARVEAAARTFPVWIPHVTLGYPETPAFGEPDFTQITFDRLALWIDEDREEFPLEQPEIVHSDRVNNYLAHHGVKGMKWGRRKDKLPSVDARRAQRLRTKSLDELTNKQLKELNNRDNMERQWRQAHPNGFTKGRNLATAALATAGLGVSAYNLVKSQAGQAAIKSGQELFKKLVK